jgi:hypothetical protein
MVLAVVGAMAVLGLQAMQSNKPLGYPNTPMLPDGKWRVHDGARPQPVVVTPGAVTAPIAAPSDAVVLFDGRDLSKWRGAKDAPARWSVADGAMTVVARTGDIHTTELFGDVQLHIEWASPAAVSGDSQGRGNSGIFLMERYEIQVLDSYNNPTYPDGQAGAVYGQMPPLVNASRPPGEWQTFDIAFTAPRFKGSTLVSPARVTVLHNGVLIQHDTVLIGSTAHQMVGKYEPHPDAASIRLQDHGNPVRFRNVWARRLTGFLNVPIRSIVHVDVSPSLK